MPKGLLLFGPPGTGKTLIAKCISNNVPIALCVISSSWIAGLLHLFQHQRLVAHVEMGLSGAAYRDMSNTTQDR